MPTNADDQMEEGYKAARKTLRAALVTPFSLPPYERDLVTSCIRSFAGTQMVGAAIHAGAIGFFTYDFLRRMAERMPRLTVPVRGAVAGGVGLILFYRNSRPMANIPKECVFCTMASNTALGRSLRDAFRAGYGGNTPEAAEALLPTAAATYASQFPSPHAATGTSPP